MRVSKDHLKLEVEQQEGDFRIKITQLGRKGSVIPPSTVPLQVGEVRYINIGEVSKYLVFLQMISFLSGERHLLSHQKTTSLSKFRPHPHPLYLPAPSILGASGSFERGERKKKPLPSTKCQREKYKLNC